MLFGLLNNFNEQSARFVKKNPTYYNIIQPNEYLRSFNATYYKQTLWKDDEVENTGLENLVMSLLISENK